MKVSTITTVLTAVPSATAISHAEAASRFSAAGMTSKSSGDCTDRTVSTCTSFDGIREPTVAGAITLKRACACSLTITGGTEVGHAGGQYSHANGYKLDFAKNSVIDSYIKSTFTKIANRGDGYPQWKAASGNIYCDEGNHWDVTFYSNGS